MDAGVTINKKKRWKEKEKEIGRRYKALNQHGQEGSAKAGSKYLAPYSGYVHTCVFACSCVCVNSKTSMGVRGWRERRTERAIDPFYSNLERHGLLCTAFVLTMYALYVVRDFISSAHEDSHNLAIIIK